jgi:hypothetical protein
LSCWKTWSKFHCCRKGRMIGSRVSSLYFMAFSVSWTILSWVRPSWKIPAQTITLTLVRKTFPMPAVHTITSIAKTKIGIHS